MALYRWLVYVCLAVLPIAAADTDPQQRFAGTWEAKFKGTVFCTIKLKAGERISGATYACRIHVNANGDLVEPDPAEGADTPAPILDPVIDGDTLSFEMSDDGDGRIKLTLTLTGDGVADLHFLNAPVEIKPIRFQRK